MNPENQKIKKTKQMKINKKYLVSILIFILIVSIAIATQRVIQTTDFNSGTYNNTIYNSSSGTVHLNYTDSSNTTYEMNGTYTSPVFDLENHSLVHTISWNLKEKSCPTGMAFIPRLHGFCIDKYEASMPNANATHMGNATEIANRNNPGTMSAQSVAGVIPWVEISQVNAKTACENAGKHLCSSEEWLAAANIKGQVYYLDEVITECNVVSGIPAECTDLSYNNGDACTTGYMTDCVSAEGVYDMVGNVWDWTSDVVTTIAPGVSDGWYYPSDLGWQTTQNTETEKYGDDGVYYLGGTTTNRAVRRGGKWNFYDEAGVFCARMYDNPTDSFSDLGFRCCR